ncbi:putative signal transduction histidine-protein kinase [Triangularia verruculosa]|uniref:Signal transduction histidine-protein kinase n=1 Tax=Triangularia verruculosa TaxID=2587418 RepID=A0AAN6XK93_9PEZI|nr:putative signal transduction histidine-protein kinase [Triangularia verruculosa]
MSVDGPEAPVPAVATACGDGVEVKSSERARQREIAAYLSAASFPPGLPAAFAEKVTLNSDPILNALTQLGAFRLGCDRAFVSLIDRTYQYVVTEMTRSHSIHDMRCDPGDTVAIGVCKLRNCDGVCPATMKAFMDETGEWVKTGPDIIANRTRYIINDFTTHPDYMHRPYVKNYPFFRSYLEVPLVSPLGYIMGSYCVVDSKPNDFDTDEKVEILNDIASAIMGHLENVRIKQSRDRSEQLIRGLSGFIRHEPPAQRPSRASALTVPIPSHITSPEEVAGNGRAGDESKPVARAETVDVQSSDGSQRPEPLNVFSSSSVESAQSALSLSSESRQTPSETPPTTPQEEMNENPMEQHMEAVIARANADEPRVSPNPPAPSSETSEAHGNGFISSANIKTTFFRAATTIRRSMDMDGLMFLDAVPSSYTDRSDQPTLSSYSDTPHDHIDGPFCATIVKSCLGPTGENITHSSQTRLPEVSLQRFIRAFPQGKVFTADEFGPIDDSYGPGKRFQSSRQTPDQTTLRLRDDIAALFRVLPAAKYVVFLPLWHFQRECWYAATLGWVEDPTRAIDITDIGLVSAFGNSVMAEVSRLEALAASRAKSDFVSSLSHELRSPLHGIMASSELLRENMSSSPLLPTLDMLDSCATTLLDTFNNLLDHAIVTHAGRDRDIRTPTAPLRVVDLGVLVEEVVEAIRIGHLSGNAFHMQSSQLKKIAEPVNTTVPDRPLLITVNVAMKTSWKLATNAGAWKRIVMNIFGNALKYTLTGRIEVKLKIVQRLDKTGKPSEHISFSVQDTGLGMSSDYLKYHLFTPFSQENSHSPGMGLGLSIVQQLVNDLDGMVEVQSSVGIGTCVEVFVPLKGDDLRSADVTPRALTQPARQSFDMHRQRLNGRTLCLITSGAYGATPSTSMEADKKLRLWTMSVERAIRSNASEALGITVIVPKHGEPLPPADIYVLDTGASNETARKNINDFMVSHSQLTPLVLLCSGSGPPSCLKSEATRNHALHIHHPVGPRKLASVLYAAVETKPPAYTIQLGNTVQAASVAQWATPVPLLRSVSPGPKLERPLIAAPCAAPPVAEPQAVTSMEARENITSTKPDDTIAAQSQSAPVRHLLLVDDNPINIKLLTHVVRKLNHTFLTASNGLEAAQLYKKSLEGQEKRFDLVFMDISMPIMNGFEATREIRQMELDAGVRKAKIVALTGLSSDLSRNEATASGCDMFLTKPVKMNLVREMLNRLEKTQEGPGG